MTAMTAMYNMLTAVAVIENVRRMRAVLEMALNMMVRTCTNIHMYSRMKEHECIHITPPDDGGAPSVSRIAVTHIMKPSIQG